MFTHNPLPDYVNGSLWTLFFEVPCYIGLFIAGVLGFLRRDRFAWLVSAWAPVYAIGRYGPWPDLIYFATFSLPFIVGMTIYRYRSPAVLNGWVALGLIVLAAGLGAIGLGIEELWSLATAYGTLWLGFAPAPALLAYNRIGDFSYGTYIYGFLVGQVIAATIPGIGTAGMMALSLPISIACGAFSWIYVERPAMQLRKSFSARNRSAAAAASVPRT